MKISILLLLLATGAAFGSELTMSEEGDVTTKLPVAGMFVERRNVYYRNKERVAMIVTRKEEINGLPARTFRILIFVLPNGSWVRIGLDGKKLFEVKGNGKFYVSVTEGSVTVTAEEQDYMEVFFLKGEGQFLDGKMRESVKGEMFKTARVQAVE